VLALLASAEALLRVDFKVRLERRIKEPRDVRQRFKELEASDGDRVRLEDILHVWKEKVGHPDRFAAFFEYLRVRHWLAHGRYWELKTSRRAEPQDVFEVIDALFRVLPGFHYP
jgi:hypothetical protein